MSRQSWRQEWNAATNRSHSAGPAASPAPPPLWEASETDRTESRRQLARNYAALLRRFLEQPSAEHLALAGHLGQRALGLGLGLAELVGLHRASLAELGPALAEEMDPNTAADFLDRVLVAYETAFREFQLANTKLRYQLLRHQKRVEQLGEINGDLERQVKQQEESLAHLRDQLRAADQRFEHLIGMQEDLKKLCTQVLMLHETEQKRLSLELERRVGSWLAIIEDSLAATAKQGITPAQRAALAAPRRQLRRTAKATRQLAEELYPPVLDNMSLAFGLRECLSGFQERTGASGSFHCRGQFQRVGSPARLLLYRIARELFSSPLLGPAPERVDMILHQVNGSIQLQIRLQDKEHLLGSKAPPSQWLLLQERVRLLNGQFSADTDSGPTAVLRVTLPLASQDRDPRG